MSGRGFLCLVRLPGSPLYPGLRARAPTTFARVQPVQLGAREGQSARGGGQREEVYRVRDEAAMAGAVLDAKGRCIHGSALASNNAIVTSPSPVQESRVQYKSVCRLSTVENAVSYCAGWTTPPHTHNGCSHYLLAPDWSCTHTSITPNRCDFFQY